MGEGIVSDDYFETLYDVTSTNMAQRTGPILTDTCPHGCTLTARLIPNHAEAILRKLLAEHCIEPLHSRDADGNQGPPYSVAAADDDGWGKSPQPADLTPDEYTYLTNLLGDETP